MPLSQNCPSASGASHARVAPSVALIAAVASNRVIGARNRLPWRLPDDLRRFRSLTVGHAVIMGRKTWESLPHALSDRQNIVVTRQRGFTPIDAEVAESFEAALALVRLPEPAFCIGGGELYCAALARAARLHLTEIEREFQGDTEFPALSHGDWREIAREPHRSDGPDGFDYAFVTYERAAPAD